eukprot:Skav204213  [mRNA]  locus=scaffold1606:126427:148764:- [translate_table: standard]
MDAFSMTPSTGYFPRELLMAPYDAATAYDRLMPSMSPPGLTAAPADWQQPRKVKSGCNAHELMAKALADLYQTIPPQHAVRLTQLLATLSQKGGKLSESDHAMLSHIIRILEESVERDVQKLTGTVRSDASGSEGEFDTPTASTLAEVEDDLTGAGSTALELSPRYVPSMTSSSSLTSYEALTDEQRLGSVSFLL